MKTPSPRLPCLDSLRGALLVLMIFEHARQIIGGGVILETMTSAGFTMPETWANSIRLLSHLCAPGFFFLLGISMVLRIRQTAITPHDAWRGFLKRGLFLLVLQVSVENIGWAFPVFWQGGLKEWHDTPLYLGVLFGLGGATILTASLLRLSSVTLALLATLLVSSSHWILPVGTAPWLGWLVSGYHGKSVEILYPLFPWTGIALWGVLFARHGILEHRVRRSWAWGAILVSAAGLAWCIGGALANTSSAFFAFYKYPPSLSFTCGTMSILLLLFLLFARVPATNLYLLQLLGRHSLPLYLGHLYLLGMASLLYYHAGMQSVFTIGGVVVLLGAGWCWRLEKTARSARISNRFNRYSPFYDRFMRLLGLYRYQEIRQFLPAGGPQRSLLDVGGGTGYVAAQLADRFARVVVVDPSEGMLTIARSRKLETCQASAEALPFPDNTFDTVICTDALHHIRHAEQAIAEMRRVLKPGGSILIQEFHIHGLAGWVLFWFERLCIDHAIFLTPAQLDTLLTRHGMPGTIHPISRLEYIYVGRKTARDQAP